MSDTDPRELMMETIGRSFAELCERPDGLEYATRWLDGRVVFYVDRNGIDVRDVTLPNPAKEN